MVSYDIDAFLFYAFQQLVNVYNVIFHDEIFPLG